MVAAGIVIMYSGDSFGQFKVTGKVTDTTFHALTFATIELYKDSLRLKSSVTDSAGGYTLENIQSGIYSLRCSYLGNKPWTKEINVTNDIVVNITYRTSSKNLAGITVTGRTIEQVGDKLYFNVENSMLSRGYNGIEVLQRSPKLNIGPDGEILLSNKAAIVLINGRKMPLQGAALNTYLSGLNAEEIRRIEIQDVASSEQDATSGGGVINIITKKNPHGFKVIAKASYLFRKNSYSTENGALNLNYGTEKWAVYGAVNYNKDKDLGKSTGAFNYKSGVKNNNAEVFDQNEKSTDYRAGIIYYPDKKQETGIEGYYNQYHSNFDGYGTQQLDQVGLPAINSEIHSISGSNDCLWYLTFNYVYKTDEKGSNFKFIGDVGNNKNLPYNDVQTNYRNDAAKDSHDQYNTTALSNYYTLQIDWTKKLAGNFDFQSGIKYGRVKRNNELISQYLENGSWIYNKNQYQKFDNQEGILAWYASASKQWQKQYLKIGLRIENTDIKGLNKINDKNVKQNYTRLFPSLYYNYSLKNDMGFSISYKRSITRPFFSDLNPYTIKQNDYLYFIGNPYLQPLYMDAIRIAFDFPQQSISIFARKTTNTIQGAYYTDSNLVNYFQPQNFGKFCETGIDYTYAGNISKWWYASINTGVFYNSFDAIDGVNTAGLSFYNNIYCQFKISKAWSVDLSNFYQHRYKNKNLLGEPKYKTDLSIRNTSIKNIILTLRSSDIFNTRIDENTSYYKNFDSYFRLKKLTRSFMFSIQYTFDNKKKLNTKTVKSDNESRQRL